MNTKSKELILSSVVSGEVGQLGTKLSFWGLDAPTEAGSLWEGSQPLTLEKALDLVNPETDDLESNDRLRQLYCLAWEFVWGKPAPEMVQAERETLLVKARFSLPMTDLERLWLSLAMIDTDMF